MSCFPIIRNHASQSPDRCYRGARNLQRRSQQSEKTEETTTIIIDGAYGSKEVNKLVEDKNIIVKTTGLRGHKVRELLSGFEVSEDGLTILKCPKGYTALHSSYNEKYNYIRASFNRSCCENCPHREECLAKLYVRTARVKISPDAIRKVELFKEHRTSEEWKKIARIRNGVETVPSVLRNKYTLIRCPSGERSEPNTDSDWQFLP